MSKRTVVLASCNLCPDGAADFDARELSYVTLNIEGGSWGLDLCDEHFLEVKGTLQQYITKADPVGGGAKGTAKIPGNGTGSATGAGLDPAVVRAWARGVGMEVPEVGRLNLDIINAYQAAQGSSPAQTPAPAF